ncbi:lipase 3 isoform X2 [Cryptotermes secundus]|uniref:lipase 3 isoform X2 n=1 Tax=Cryptotermes secundus TaxID=105785 RepID=UPI000CD7C352|nr:lipase 3 isoform X2 [Cryptotermes secundus]
MVAVTMHSLLTLALLILSWPGSHRNASSQMSDDNDADIYLTSPELIAKYGYPVQRHSVQTQEGYILELHRIPHGRPETTASPRPAVLLHHAFLCSSFDWVVLGPDKSLGFILADAGYDVWLANARGNTYSRKHVSLNPSDPKFWQYSWHEMGTHDVPAEIDHILAMTGQKKLYYIGHSMGTTMFFVMMSQRPEYNEKIYAMLAFAPVAFFTPSKNPVIHFVQTMAEMFLEKLFKVIGLNEFLPQDGVLNPISIAACKASVFTNSLCVGFIFSIVGKSTQLDRERLVVMLAHTPAGGSSREVIHYAQGALSGEFCQFDFGTEKNMELYGQPSPPRYNMSHVTTPVAMFHSDNDKLAPIYNVNKVFSALSNVIGNFRVPLKTFNHLDFMWGKDANSLVYEDVVNIMKRYEDDA